MKTFIAKLLLNLYVKLTKEEISFKPKNTQKEIVVELGTESTKKEKLQKIQLILDNLLSEIKGLNKHSDFLLHIEKIKKLIENEKEHLISEEELTRTFFKKEKVGDIPLGKIVVESKKRQEELLNTDNIAKELIENQKEEKNSEYFKNFLENKNKEVYVGPTNLKIEYNNGTETPASYELKEVKDKFDFLLRRGEYYPAAVYSSEKENIKSSIANLINSKYIIDKIVKENEQGKIESIEVIIAIGDTEIYLKFKVDFFKNSKDIETFFAVYQDKIKFNIDITKEENLYILNIINSILEKNGLL